jgi:hypothetical protein
VIVRLWLPDRPGALGAAASRMGALGADIRDVNIERHEMPDNGQLVVLDEFHLDLPAHDGLDLVALLHSELEEVDGTAVLSIDEADCCQDRPTPADR